MYPTVYPNRTEWEIILSKATSYTKEYLSNPEMWKPKYYQNGKMLFYDDETYSKMYWKHEDHLVDHWHVSIRLIGTKVRVEISNDKTVEGSKDWNLEELLFNGTSDYESENDMIYWWRFDERWHKKKKRRGIRTPIVKSFKALQYDAVEYGIKKAYGEWKSGFI